MTPGTLMLPLFLFATLCGAAEHLGGRLFFAPAERRTLENHLEHPPEKPPAQPSVSRRFNGALWHNGRIVTLWIDGAVATEPSIHLNSRGTTLSGRALLPGQSFQTRESNP